MNPKIVLNDNKKGRRFQARTTQDESAQFLTAALLNIPQGVHNSEIIFKGICVI